MKDKEKKIAELEAEYVELRDYFGAENLRLDVHQEISGDSGEQSLFIDESKVEYVKVRVTHIPTGKEAYGENFDTQLENLVEALRQLKKEVNRP